MVESHIKITAWNPNQTFEIELDLSKLKAKDFRKENPELISPNNILRIQYPVRKI